MNFQIAAGGASFKGAFAYYLHDKRQEGQSDRAQTSERVAWTETRNLATDGAHTASRIMIATAKEAEAKKAGNSGRKATKPVFAMSLAWHPDEAQGLDRAEMVRAADHALKVMGLDHLQAVIIAHKDTAHPHVHIVVSRVDADSGKLHIIPPTPARALNKWAYEYEKERGNIVSPNRAKAQEEAAAAKISPNPTKSQAAPKVDSAPVKPRSEAALLKDLTDAQRARHKAEWPSLSKSYATAKDAIYARAGAQMKVTAAQHKEDTRSDWREFFKEQKAEARQVAKLEKTTLGLLAVSVACAKEQMRRGIAPNRGMLSLTFSNMLSSQRRAATYAAIQERDRLALANRLKAQLDQKMQTLKDQRAKDLAQARRAFDQERAALIARQNIERDKIREAWRQVYGRDRLPQPKRAQDAPSLEFFTVKGEFDQKAQGLPFAPKMPTEARYISQPAPTPSPMGEVKTPARVVQDVPKMEKVAPAKEAPTAASVWERVATPPAPTPSTEKAADVWARLADKNPAPREIKPLPTRDKDYDRDR